MPRRIYTYDANQGYTGFNLASTIGTVILVIGIAISLWNLWTRRKSGEVAGNDPWEAGTLEWSIPSPPPDYNFAELPHVTSRYPLWDVTHPEITHDRPTAPTTTGVHVEQRTTKTAAELGIPMPNPSIMPLVCAAGVIVMFSGLLFLEKSTKLGVGISLLGAAWWVSALYNWLTTPLEDAH